MKTIRIFAAAVAIATVSATVASCSIDNPNENPGEPVAVNFTAAIEGATATTPSTTRAAGDQWNTGDAIGVFMMTGNLASETNRRYNASTTGGNTFSAAAGDMYYPMDGRAVNFIAYYPFEEGAALGTPLDIAVATTQTAENQPTFDVLWAGTDTGYSKYSTGAVALAFEHKLAKIVMNTSAADNVGSSLSGMAVSIAGMNTEAELNLSDGTLGTPGTTADITPRTIGDGALYDAIIMPDSYSAGDDLKVTFTLTNGETFTWSMGATSFAAGNEYTYNVTLTRTGVTVTGNITPWITTDNDRGNFEAE